jgi:hypothetical protein
MADGTAVNGHQPWHEKLLVPFPELEIGIRPQLWCTDCAKADNKVCGKTLYDVKHERKKCKVCGQNVSVAHLHLYYIGHAHLTRRLIQVDPRWRWEPMHRDIDHPEVLIAAIQTGDRAIIQMVLDQFPPKLTSLEWTDSRGNARVEHGMWIRLILHDDDGTEITMIGFGDAKGKVWGGDALKEIIGDALRNASMRRGGALGLWESQDRERAAKERREYNPDPDDGRSGASARAALFDDDPPAIGSGRPPAEVDNLAQADADLAWQLARQMAAPDALRSQVHERAAAGHRLGAKVHPPWAPDDPAARVTLSQVLTRARRICDGKEEFPHPQPASEAADIINATGA